MGLPTCAFLGTFASGGVTAGGPEGEGIGFVGVVRTAPHPVWFVFARVFNCCLTFFSLALAISCFLSDRNNFLKNSFNKDLIIGVSASKV